jgi:polygalacturonase
MRGATGAVLFLSISAVLPACGAGARVPGIDDTAGDSGGALRVESGANEGGGSIEADGGTGGAGPQTTACGAGDPKMPLEPVIAPMCTTLNAGQTVMAGMLPDETNPDTARIQAALDSCGAGRAVRLAADGAHNAFLSGPISLPSGVTLWIDSGVTLFASRNPMLYGPTCAANNGSCSAFIAARSAHAAVVGEGTIDGQGGELILGQAHSWWELTASSNGNSANPTLIQAIGATDFTLYRITLHNSPKFHVKLDANGFVVWGVTIKTPSASTNAQGTPLTPSGAHNTDGIDPGESASNGYIVCSNISDGDDQIAIKGGTSVSHLTIAHNHFGAGHGMSIGSETSGGVSDVSVYDLTIDGSNSGMGGGSSNGIRIKSDPSVGGLVTNVSYSDVCVRGLVNPIVLTPRYSNAAGTSTPRYSGITISNFRSVASTVNPVVTILGYDASHVTEITLDNVVVDGIAPANVKAAFASVTMGPGSVNFTPVGSGVTVTNQVSGNTQPPSCDEKWVPL